MDKLSTFIFCVYMLYCSCFEFAQGLQVKAAMIQKGIKKIEEKHAAMRELESKLADLQTRTESLANICFVCLVVWLFVCVFVRLSLHD